MARAPSLRSWIVIAALFAPLVSLVVVALRTVRAERVYAAVTQQVVHDYAGIAAWQFARRANGTMHDQAMNALRHDSTDHQAVMPPEAVLALLPRTAPDIAPRARYAFSIDFPLRRIKLSKGSTREDSAAIADRLTDLASARLGDDPHRALLYEGANGPELTAVSFQWARIHPPYRPTGSWFLPMPSVGRWKSC